MDDEQPQTTTAAAESSATLGESQPEPATGAQDSLPSTANEIRQENSQQHKLQSRQQKLDLHRESVLKGIQGLQVKIEKVPEVQLNKRLELREKLQVFESQLQSIGEEQADLDRQKEFLAREEQQAVIFTYVKMRQQLGQDGAEVADKLRQALGVVEGLYSEWRDLKERDRVALDILRSRGPDQMTASPHFSWSTGVDANFTVALDQAIRECHRSQAEIHARVQAAASY